MTKFEQSIKFTYLESPLQILLSFEPLIQKLNDKVQQGRATESERLLLEEAQAFPQLIEGFKKPGEMGPYLHVIDKLLAPLFPDILTNNEIKAITIPYTEFFFRESSRLKGILKYAQGSFLLAIRNLDDHQLYILQCCLILNQYYNTDIDPNIQRFYHIADQNGIERTYRILYNADYTTILPTKQSKHLTQSQLRRLIDNYDNIKLWKKHFPPGSYVLKGFTVMNMFDSTIETAISDFKESLVGASASNLIPQTEQIIKRVFKTTDAKCGLLIYNSNLKKLFPGNFNVGIGSFFSVNSSGSDPQTIYSKRVCENLIRNQSAYAISSLSAGSYEAQFQTLPNFNRRGSLMLAPIAYNGETIGVLEAYSKIDDVFSSISVQKLSLFLPFLAEALKRMLVEHEIEIQALIQNLYTSLHRSVYWKFQQAAERQIRQQHAGTWKTPEPIKFNDVYAFFGQLDVKASSEIRNRSIRQDLINQLEGCKLLIVQIRKKIRTESEVARLTNSIEQQLHEINHNFNISSEQHVNTFLNSIAHPWIRQHQHSGDLLLAIENYFSKSTSPGYFFYNRMNFESAIGTINENLSQILNSRQQEAQEIVRHYFEKHTTDGIDFTLYAGQAISTEIEFTSHILHSLRIWQLETFLQLIHSHNELQTSLPVPMSITGLILADSYPLTINFRMDEHHFDVDNTLYARHEILKKRLDKAKIKNTAQRIVEPGKITIVFTHENDDVEYSDALAQLSIQKRVNFNITRFEVEDLQNIQGLSAMQISWTATIDHDNHHGSDC